IVAVPSDNNDPGWEREREQRERPPREAVMERSFDWGDAVAVCVDVEVHPSGGDWAVDPSHAQLAPVRAELEQIEVALVLHAGPRDADAVGATGNRVEGVHERVAAG